REQWEKDIAHTLTNTEQVVVKLGNQRSLYDQWTQWDIGIPGTQEVDEALSSLFNTSNEESRRQQVQSWNEYEVQLFRFFAQVILDKSYLMWVLGDRTMYQNDAMNGPWSTMRHVCFDACIPTKQTQSLRPLSRTFGTPRRFNSPN